MHGSKKRKCRRIVNNMHYFMWPGVKVVLFILLCIIWNDGKRNGIINTYENTLIGIALFFSSTIYTTPFWVLTLFLI